MSNLYLPGVGNVEPDVYRAHLVVQEYDERLSFRLNEKTGDYCAYVKTPRPHSEDNPPEVPVIGFGKTVPPREEILRRLIKADTVRRGSQILDEIHRNNDRIRANLKYRADQAIGDAAEHVEQFMRLEGDTPHFKSFRPRVRG